MRKFAKAVTVFFAVMIVSACSPRGETRSLDQILSGAKERFSASTAANLDAETNAALNKLVDGLKQLESGQVADAFAEQSAEMLGQLEGRAGYTSRPAMRELVGQFKGLTASSGAGATRLLVARTYNLLASELETTHFAIR